jgi:hypothetical protein
MAQAKLEYRIVCSGANEHAHRRHQYPKATLAKARQSVIDGDHDADMHPGHYVSVCAPWSIETRDVSKWERLED